MSKKKPLVIKTARGRFYILGVLFALWMGAIGWRLFYLQVTRFPAYRARSEAQRNDVISTSPRRGVIVDRNGSELARSAETDSVFVYTREVKEPGKVARILAPLLGERETDLYAKLTDATNRFVWLRRKVDFDTANAVSAALQRTNLAGVHVVKEPQRYYPNGALASHLIGYVNIDEKGLAGLELTQDEKLRGKPGQAYFTTDAKQAPLERHDNPAGAGGRVVTTIDAAIQHQVESILGRGREQTKSRSASAIVLDPRTGEILAMANAPNFDPNVRPRRADDKEDDRVRRNRAITDVYEPGSVFKIVTWSGVLEEGLVRSEDKIDCQGGRITLYGREIKDAHPHGVLTVADALAKSSNIAAIKLAQKLTSAKLADYVSRFGFGQKTGVDLPGEVSGIFNPLKNWHGSSYASIAMGHEIGVTALQSVTAMATIANGGVRVQPHIVRKVITDDNQVSYQANPVTTRVISEKTARTVAGMLEDVVARGTARGKVALAGYKAAGKTGTAQKVLETGGYSDTQYVASFAGFVPATNPRFAIIVTLDEPVGLHQGGQVAAPIFGEIAEAALAAHLVQPDSEEYRRQIARMQEKATPAGTPVSLTDTTAPLATMPEIAAARPVAAAPKAAPAVKSNTTVSTPAPTPSPARTQAPARVAETPAPKKPERNGAENAVARTAAPPVPAASVIPPTTAMGVMPDLRGRGMRAVAQACASLDLKLSVSGSGVAVRQFPAPGTKVRAGEMCRVEFQ
ncbi:MAG: penicillin-binding transpeptidase domain-containing protein [Blastocatellia bacterium]